MNYYIELNKMALEYLKPYKDVILPWVHPDWKDFWERLLTNEEK